MFSYPDLPVPIFKKIRGEKKLEAKKNEFATHYINYLFSNGNQIFEKIALAATKIVDLAIFKLFCVAINYQLMPNLLASYWRQFQNCHYHRVLRHKTYLEVRDKYPLRIQKYHRDRQ